MYLIDIRHNCKVVKVEMNSIEKQAIKKAQSGNKEAFSWIIREYERTLFYTSKSILSDTPS